MKPSLHELMFLFPPAVDYRKDQSSSGETGIAENCSGHACTCCRQTGPSTVYSVGPVPLKNALKFRV